jgi:hypothetical protein
MNNTLKIGDRVQIIKEKANQGYAPWYSTNTFTIKSFVKEDVVELDKNLSYKHLDNKINTMYLRLVKLERKKKLLKLNSLYK